MTSLALATRAPSVAADAPSLRPTVLRAERTADALIGLLAAALETAGLVALWHLGLVSILTVVAVHALTVAALWCWLAYRATRAADVSGPHLLLLATVATGPIGAFAASLSALAPARPAGDAALLTAWYDRIAEASGVDEITQLSDGIAIGRTIDLAKPTGSPFVDVMRGADVEAQQTVLGLIARSFKPDYVPALVAGLKSGEPIIRVQAAAVATRIRPSLVAVVTAASKLSVTRADDGPDAEGVRLVARRHVELALASGLLDSADVATAHTVVANFDAHRADPVERFRLRGRTVRELRAISSLAPAVRHQIEARLISDRRYGDLRRLRAITRIGAGRLFRVRSMPRPAPALRAITDPVR